MGILYTVFFFSWVSIVFCAAMRFNLRNAHINDSQFVSIDWRVFPVLISINFKGFQRDILKKERGKLRKESSESTIKTEDSEIMVEWHIEKQTEVERYSKY